MAKKTSNKKSRGKIGQAQVDGKYGRKASKGGRKKGQAALKKQNARTHYLNKLASELKRIIHSYGGILIPKGFYQLLLKHFRKEPLDNRFLLLKQLEGMEVNSKYPLNKLGDARVTVTDDSKTITVRLEVLYHPPAFAGKYKVDCYSYEVALVCWANDDVQPSPMRQVSEWISLNDDLPDFDFEFKRPADTVHWLVCLKQQTGFNKEPILPLVGAGMQIVCAGTFDKKDIELFTKRKREKAAQAEKLVATQKEEDVIRVKAKTKRKL